MIMATAPPSASHIAQPLSIFPNDSSNISRNFLLRNSNRNLRLNQFQILNYFRSPTTRFSPSKASILNSPPANGVVDAQLHTVTTLRELCEGNVPEHVLSRMEEMGFVTPTTVQQQGLPILFSGSDCLLQAQTGSGKTLTYLLLVFSIINAQKSAVQALIVVPTRELGMQVTKVARMLAARPTEFGQEQQKACTVMSLLDGGQLRRHKTWLKMPLETKKNLICLMFQADPPTLVVATVVDFMFNSSRQVSSLRKLLTSYSSSHSRQTVFASASIPQHRRFLHDCMQQKWTKSNVVHVHVNPVEPMPSCLNHRYMVCQRNQKYQALLSLLQLDLPESAIVFVNEQSEKSKKAGEMPSATVLIDFLKSAYGEFSGILLLEEDMNFNSRATSLLEVRQRSGYLLVATDLAARGVDLPETTHIYNFDMPKSAVHYLHRAGRTGRKPFSNNKCIVTTIIAPEEQFVLHRFENELKFRCEQHFL